MESKPIKPWEIRELADHRRPENQRLRYILGQMKAPPDKAQYIDPWDLEPHPVNFETAPAGTHEPVRRICEECLRGLRFPWGRLMATLALGILLGAIVG